MTLRASRTWAVGRVLPLLVAMLLLGDALARLLPVDSLCFQAWECMTRFQEPGAIFEANRQFSSARTHGNLSNMGNLPLLRQYRPQLFTTDRNGFRNVADAATTTPDGLVLGDSFVAGYGLSDDETFPVQLSRTTGRRFYNAGGPYAYRHTVQMLQSRLGLIDVPAVIVWTESEPVDQLQDAEALASAGDSKTRLLSAVFGERAGRVRSLVRGWWYTSPARIVAEKAFLSVADDRLLPNIYASRVQQDRLQTGESILFYPPDVDGFHRARDSRPAEAFLMTLARDLRQMGLHPLVVLAPSKYTVYYPLLAEPKPASPSGTPLLSTLATALTSAGVPALDLTDAFRERARRDLTRGQYIYWLDDTHWDGSGVALAAELAGRAWFPDSGRLARAAAPVPGVSIQQP